MANTCKATLNDVICIPYKGIGIVKAATLTVNPCDFVIQNGANSEVGQAVIQIAKA
ncbi:hypothetical protein C2G38_2210186 [Gigaspora rosea]|uniref:Uncharacterized protein n=1 Tax=Gigaspora rosea TaxID=44941 RepID=A0A397UF78_9GLOM|nr:hypothetical protein C2G38_2210186 [Gigaspora rosea]